MWHRVKKIKFRAGSDANQMLIKKLANNFFAKGKLTTTFKKAKVLKSVIEKLVEKTKEKTEANKNYLLHYIINKQILKLLFDNVGPVLKDKKGGYVRLIRLGARDSDGAEEARVEWVYPIVIDEKKAPPPAKGGIRKDKETKKDNKVQKK